MRRYEARETLKLSCLAEAGPVRLLPKHRERDCINDCAFASNPFKL